MSTPQELRKQRQQPHNRSRYEIEHGSTDFSTNARPDQLSTRSWRETNESNIAPSAGDGLHHRRRHDASPPQEVSKGILDLRKKGRLESRWDSDSKLNNRRTANINKQTKSRSAWVVVLSFGVAVLGYIVFIFMAQSKYWAQQDKNSLHEQIMNSPRQPVTKEAKVTGRARVTGSSSITDFASRTPLHPSVPSTTSSTGGNYAFSHLSKQPYNPPPSQTSAGVRANDWFSDRLKSARSHDLKRNRERKQKTRPKNDAKESPLWYKLGNTDDSTLMTNDQRWSERPNTGRTDQYDTTFQLCGEHARGAAQTHPDNYFPLNSINGHHEVEPLGPSSRVFITGLLSPLGVRLALALSEQCNVTSIYGTDSQFPNEPLARLEMSERLQLLMNELGGAVEISLPFLGLAVSSSAVDLELLTQSIREDGRRLATGLLGRKLRQSLESNTPRKRAARGDKYGLPSNPGLSPNGAGILNDLLDYKPTHVVHLAPTQSDALLRSRVSPTDHLTNREEEEEDVLQETISTRPHLYDLRMNNVAMEQLLSTLSNRALRKSGRVKGAGALPHFVYASSHDAMRFADSDKRMNDIRSRQNRVKSQDSDENVGVAGRSDHRHHKRPPRDLHGMSHLQSEIMASSYNSMYGISAVGLRFDAIYGKRGFGTPSTSVPLFHSLRTRKRRGTSPVVDTVETAIRRNYRKWMDFVRAVKKELENGDEEEEEGEDENTQSGRRLTSVDGQPPTSLVEEAGWSHLAHYRRDFVYLDDAVEGIIAAMQYRPTQGSPTVFNIGSGESSTLSSFADDIEDLIEGDDRSQASDKRHRHHRHDKKVIDVEQSSAAQLAGITSGEYLGWAASTSIQDGAARMLAWHLDRAMPYFPSANIVGASESDFSALEAFYEDGTTVPRPIDSRDVLSRRGISLCSSEDDPTCSDEGIYPCASECSASACISSPFDSIIDLSHEVTEDCDVVLYTMSLGYDVENLSLETEYSDGTEQEGWLERTVCTIAYIPSESQLVKSVIEQIPPSSLRKRGLTKRHSFEEKVHSLNGYLAHKGWVLVLLPGAIDPLPSDVMYIPKLSPARLFHPTVRKSMFVDEQFTHIPYPDDAQFLSYETARGTIKERKATGGPDSKGKKKKYVIPEEPERRAVLLVSPMRNKPKVSGDKMPLDDVAKSLMNEVGMGDDEVDDNDLREVDTQREFYELSRSFINSLGTRTPNYASHHVIEIESFIRSRWVVHHLKLDEGHQLRCQWYREHVKWNTHLDQLSFAYIMAKRDLVRKIITRQPLRKEETIVDQIIRMKTDAHEWNPLYTLEDAPHAVHHSEIIPKAIPDNIADLPEHEVSDVKPAAEGNDAPSFYVRIMSDAVMMQSRKQWLKARNKRRQIIEAQRSKEE